MPPPTERPHVQPMAAVWWPLLLAAGCAALVFAYAVSQRLLYPHELEWMEGALVDHASRVVDGLPIYCAPGPEHVPFLYAPMLFWLGGLGMALGLDGLQALRLVAVLASLGTAAMLGHWVRVATGRIAPGLVASGLFFAGYGWLAWWYDLARNDALLVFWLLAAAFLLRHGGRRGWLWAGCAATAAVLAKQSAVMWLPAVGVGALCWQWRDALRFAAVTVLGSATALGALHLTSDGWSTFYLFEMPRHHGWVGEKKLGFWTEDVVPILPLLALSVGGFAARCRAGQTRDALYLAAVGSGAVVTSWFSRMHVGGFDNVLMYGFAGACLCGPIAAATDARWLRAVGPPLLLVQFLWLGYEARLRAPGATLLPSPAHRLAHEQLRAFVAAQDGPVWIPAHGGITRPLGKGTGAHGQAIFDLMQLLPRQPDGMLDTDALDDPSRLAELSPRAQLALVTFMSSTERALREARYAAVVVDEIGAGAFPSLFEAGLVGPDGRLGTEDDPYVRQAVPLSDPAAIRPLVGYELRSPYAFVRR